MTISENHTYKSFPPTARSRHFQRSKFSLRHPPLPGPHSHRYKLFSSFYVRDLVSHPHKTNGTIKPVACPIFRPLIRTHQRHFTLHTTLHSARYTSLCTLHFTLHTTLHSAHYTSFSAFSTTHFGRCCCHLQCDVNITTIQRY